MEQTECSETWAYKIQTPGNYPEESIQYAYHTLETVESYCGWNLNYSNICPTRCNITQFILSGNCSTCFGRYHHPSLGAQTTVSTASGICHIVTATCRCRGKVGTGLSVLYVTATCRFHGRGGTGLSVLCTAHSNQFQLFHDSDR